MLTVSLIVPRRPVEPFIDECLASIRAQPYDEIELIVIEDKDGKGPAWARNEGLNKATGEYLAFVDADDILAVDAIETLVRAIDGVDMVCGSFRKFGTFEMTVQHDLCVFTPADLADYVMANLLNPRSHQMLSGCWAKLYRREFMQRFPVELLTGEDMVFNFAYLDRCHLVRFIPDIVYHNRKHPQSLTTTFDEKNKMALFGVFKALWYVKNFLCEFYDANEIEDAIDNAKRYHATLYFMRIVESTKLPMNEAFRKLYP